jgi:hypothetical protein
LPTPRLFDLAGVARIEVEEVWDRYGGACSPAATVLAARKADGTVKERTVVCGELDELRGMLAEFAKEVHDFCEMSHKSCAIASRTVIDSGSGGTFNSITNVTDATNVVKVTGFDGSSTLTKGNGSTTMVVVDESGESLSLVIPDTDYIDIPQDIMSMGKLIRGGYAFFAVSPTEVFLRHPSGRKIPVTLDDNNIFYLSHDAPTVEEWSLHVSRSMPEANFRLLHRIFNHSSLEKIVKTLAATHGVKVSVDDLVDEFCDACAYSKSRVKGIKSHLCDLEPFLGAKMSEDLLALVGEVEDFLDEGDESKDDVLDPVPYVADTRGAILARGTTKRFDPAKLRPFEVMFADNKDYPAGCYGGYTGVLTLGENCYRGQ